MAGLVGLGQTQLWSHAAALSAAWKCEEQPLGVRHQGLNPYVGGKPVVSHKVSLLPEFLRQCVCVKNFTLKLGNCEEQRPRSVKVGSFTAHPPKGQCWKSLKFLRCLE